MGAALDGPPAQRADRGMPGVGGGEGGTQHRQRRGVPAGQAQHRQGLVGGDDLQAQEAEASPGQRGPPALRAIGADDIANAEDLALMAVSATLAQRAAGGRVGGHQRLGVHQGQRPTGASLEAELGIGGAVGAGVDQDLHPLVRRHAQALRPRQAAADLVDPCQGQGLADSLQGGHARQQAMGHHMVAIAGNRGRGVRLAGLGPGLVIVIGICIAPGHLRAV